METKTQIIMKKLLLLILLISITDGFSQTNLPVPDHTVILILENHAYQQIIGSAEAPYINALASNSKSALFINSYAIEHPSQPNYLDLFSGCNQGVSHNDIPTDMPFTTDNLARQLLDAGKTFITYSEDLPSVGFNGSSSGRYVRKHNPVANWMGTGTNQVPETMNQPFTAFPSEDFNLLPDVCYVVPNQDDNMHDGSITTADNWINDHLSTYVEWAKNNNSLFILTFDEDNYVSNNHIVTIFTGNIVIGGEYSESIDHYSVLRTIENMHGLPYACNASIATTITECWNSPNDIHSSEIIFSVYPNPANQMVTIEISDHYILNRLKLSFFNILGEKVKEIPINASLARIQVDELKPGLYLYQLENEQRVLKTAKMIIE